MDQAGADGADFWVAKGAQISAPEEDWLPEGRPNDGEPWMGIPVHQELISQ